MGDSVLVPSFYGLGCDVPSRRESHYVVTHKTPCNAPVPGNIPAIPAYPCRSNGPRSACRVIKIFQETIAIHPAREILKLRYHWWFHSLECYATQYSATSPPATPTPPKSGQDPNRVEVRAYTKVVRWNFGYMAYLKPGSVLQFYCPPPNLLTCHRSNPRPLNVSDMAVLTS